MASGVYFFFWEFFLQEAAEKITESSEERMDLSLPRKILWAKPQINQGRKLNSNSYVGYYTSLRWNIFLTSPTLHMHAILHKQNITFLSKQKISFILNEFKF